MKRSLLCRGATGDVIGSCGKTGTYPLTDAVAVMDLANQAAGSLINAILTRVRYYYVIHHTFKAIDSTIRQQQFSAFSST